MINHAPTHCQTSAAISSTKRLQTSAKKIYFQFAECSYIFYKVIKKISYTRTIFVLLHDNCN
ncbi:hypothetical protein HMPREF0653_01394 [Prevotella disiens JCM 6334 = ATCC 29426]|uniref:Uncharacterized protein n=1 Tax=Prevotella disiens JCM 6334 = ATCC 29426 TaxID=1235811 RepID=A0ABN0NS31_9BACT|nr:hypothetical protein HMPREF0653_01394 [Prevotella disiens JCM 6334 = ATCC 29426]